MEGNREEADRALQIARTHRSQGKFTSALKFARKSLSLYETPAATALIAVIEKDIASATSANGEGSSAAGESFATKSSAETHPSAAGAHHRPGHGSGSSKAAEPSTSSAPKKRDYTPEQHKLVKRITACKVTEYYEILSVQKDCSDDEVKKAYRKLALQLHPDKNGAPGADEAFKMVSKSFTVLSDKNLRAVYDSNPRADPSSRGGGGGGGGGMARGFGGGGMNGFHQTEVDPAELFNMFFGGGGFGGGQPIFSTSFGGGGFGQGFGGGGFHNFPAQQARARARARANERETPPPTWVQMIPLVLVALFAFATILSSLFGFGPVDDPRYSWSPQGPYTAHRQTNNLGVNYYVNQAEFEKHPIWESIPEERRSEPRAGRWSQPLRKMEQSIDQNYVVNLREECDVQRHNRQSRIQANQGLFGIGADWDEIRRIQQEPLVSCEKLRGLGYSR